MPAPGGDYARVIPVSHEIAAPYGTRPCGGLCGPVQCSAPGVGPDDVALTAKDRKTVWIVDYNPSTNDVKQNWSFRLDKIIDPAQFQGGTLTPNIGGGESVDIPRTAWFRWNKTLAVLEQLW